MPPLSQLPGGAAQRLPEPEDGHAGPRRRTSLFVGGYGDYYLLPAGAVVYTVPDTVSDDIAAGANCALSQVMYGLERVDLQLGEHVVVQGAGALGLYAVAVAKARVRPT